MGEKKCDPEKEQRSSALSSYCQGTHGSLQPFQAPPGYVSPNLALKRAELSPSPGAAAGTQHPCGCCCSPYLLQPALTGSFMPPPSQPRGSEQG